MQRRTRRIATALALVVGIALGGAASSTVSAGGGITTAKGPRGDECFYRPGQLIAPPGKAAAIRSITGLKVRELTRLVPNDLATMLPPTVEQLSLYTFTVGDPLIAASQLQAAGLSAAPNYLSNFAPVRTWAPGSDPIPTGPYPPLADPTYGKGLRIGVFDTGMNGKLMNQLPGTGPVTFLRASAVANELSTRGLVSAGYVQPAELNTGRAAGHGTFIASLLRRTLPGASLVVAQVPFFNAADGSFNVAPAPGFASASSSRVDDAALTYMMYKAFVEAGKPNIDVLSLSFGSYGCNEAIAPNAGSGDFRTPIGIRGALIGLWELSGRTLIVAAAAGNDQTSEPFYPAAFAALTCFEPSEVHPGGPPKCLQKEEAISPWLAGVWSTKSSAGGYSNEGPWAMIQAQGSDVGGLLGNLSWARWSGTSFAAPCAATVVFGRPNFTWFDVRGSLIDCGLK